MRLLPCSLILAWIGCHAAPAVSSPKAAPAVTLAADSGSTLAQAHVTIRAKTGPATFAVELALDESSQEQGLMYRKDVPPETGMLFVFPAESLHVFWMKNTLVPLDMLFLSKDRKIAAILENAEPLTLTPRDPHVAAKYVLEIAGGTSFAKGFKVGDTVEFQGVQ